VDFKFPLLYSRILTIGRNSQNVIIVKKNLTVSRHHAKVYFDRPNFVVEDLDSKNGTYLNGKRIKRAVIAGGDELKIGEVVFQIKGEQKPTLPEMTGEEAFEDPSMTQIIDLNFEKLKKKAQSTEEINLVENFKQQLEKERQELQDLAFKDGLTGLYNSRYFDIELKRILSTKKRYGGRFSLLMLDIDHFKKFNDNYGHQTGDRVLAWVAQALRENVRDTDIVARYGGEEIVIIFAETGVKAAHPVAEKIREYIEKNSEPEFPTRITVSLGLAEYPREGITVEELIKSADEALYHSKKLGRNRLTLYSDIL
jgi:diguanylate cyclase (GGDEF)-like protein